MISDDVISGRIKSFKQDLLEYSNTEMINRYYRHTIEPVAIYEDVYFRMKTDIAKRYGLEPPNVFMVGSAKLGFTIKPECRYRHYGDNSDIDIAIISPELFEQFWYSVFDYKQKTKYWDDKEFKKYLLKGWIRPDKLPNGNSFSLTREWWEYFDELARKYSTVKIRAGLYFNSQFFVAYQSFCIQQCRDNMEV